MQPAWRRPPWKRGWPSRSVGEATPFQYDITPQPTAGELGRRRKSPRCGFRKPGAGPITLPSTVPVPPSGIASVAAIVLATAPPET